MKEQAKQFHWKGMVHQYLLGGSSFLSAGLSYCCVLHHFFYTTWTVWVFYFGIQNLNYHVYGWIGNRSFISFTMHVLCSFRTTVISHCGSVKFTANPNTLSYFLMFVMSQILNSSKFSNYFIQMHSKAFIPFRTSKVLIWNLARAQIWCHITNFIS